MKNIKQDQRKFVQPAITTIRGIAAAAPAPATQTRA
jgi:hypothetical protein